VPATPNCVPPSLSSSTSTRKPSARPDFLHSPAADVRAGLPTAWGVPAFIGRYRILRRHGEGGMGSVYEAEQDNPRRTVALKVIRPWLVSPELVKRFNHEAQILARLSIRYRSGL